jgi:hypothetical protein
MKEFYRLESTKPADDDKKDPTSDEETEAERATLAQQGMPSIQTNINPTISFSISKIRTVSQYIAF